MKNKIFITLLFSSLICCSKPVEKKAYTPRVEVSAVIQKTIPIGLRAVGHCKAFNSAEIKAQVEGLLDTIHYKEGSYVEKGALLITIDPRPYKAALNKALAVRAENIAKLKYSAEKVARYQTLVAEDYVSALDFDGYIKDLSEYEATVMQNDADISLAQINLDYCYIKAPFSGITSKKLVDRGNLITNDGSTMVIINQINPIFIDFSLPERDFRTIMTYKKANTPLTVDIQLPNFSLPKKAKLILVDNTIDQNTGMVPLRAQIQNCDSFFWPGQYVEANLILKEEKNALLIPSKAVSTGQKGEFVFVIGPNNIAEYRSIKTFNTYGKYTHVAAKLKSGDRVITRGIINVKPGAKCTIVKSGDKK